MGKPRLGLRQGMWLQAKVVLCRVAYCKIESLQVVLLCFSEGGLCGAGVRDAAAGV